MLKQVLNLGTIKTLSKDEQKRVNGGFFGDRCETVCYQHGDCCIYISQSPLGSFEQLGECLGLNCIPF